MDNVERTIHTRTPTRPDVEIHVSALSTDFGEYTDIREYVVSLDQYGRGITFPAALTAPVLEGLADLTPWIHDGD